MLKDFKNDNQNLTVALSGFQGLLSVFLDWQSLPAIWGFIKKNFTRFYSENKKNKLGSLI